MNAIKDQFPIQISPADSQKKNIMYLLIGALENQHPRHYGNFNLKQICPYQTKTLLIPLLYYK